MAQAGEDYIFVGGDFQRTYPMTGVLRWNTQNGTLQVNYNGWQTISIGGSGGGTLNYNELNNRPQINGVTLEGNITINAETIGALPNTTVIPSKTSDLTNDSNFVTKNYVDGLIGNASNLLNEAIDEVV
jgi:hypothetical protein